MLRTLVQETVAETARRGTLHSSRIGDQGQRYKEEDTMDSVGRDPGRHLRGGDIGTGP